MGKEDLGLEITELRLGPPGGAEKTTAVDQIFDKKRVFSDISSNGKSKAADHEKVHTKNQVVGWPPVCSHRRKNSLETSKVVYVKVSMDGAPFLRKIDINIYKGYSCLAMALEKLFGCPGIGEALKSAADCSEYVPIYEDKDGDWMLAGDVPWEMFIETCKRLRIMKRSDAKGLGLQPKRS